MAQNTGIEWCNHTVNLWWGCSKVHTGCKHCYAETLAHRYGNSVWGEKAPRKLIKSAFSDLAKYQRQAEKEGVKYTIFCGSMMDIFEESKKMIDHKGKPLAVTTGDQRNILFEGIENGLYNNLIFLFLTKRPDNVLPILSEKREDWIEKGLPKNIWLGTSISNQSTTEDLVPKLLKSVKGNYFLSVEPQVGAVDLQGYLLNKEDYYTGMGLKQPIKWVIQGGESGKGKRPFNLSWAYKLKAQCEKAGVAYFFKQIDKVKQIPKDLEVRQFPNW